MMMIKNVSRYRDMDTGISLRVEQRLLVVRQREFKNRQRALHQSSSKLRKAVLQKKIPYHSFEDMYRTEGNRGKGSNRVNV